MDALRRWIFGPPPPPPPPPAPVVPVQQTSSSALTTVARGALVAGEYATAAGLGGAAVGFAMMRASTILTQRVLASIVVPYCEHIGAVGPLQGHILAATYDIWGPTVAGSMTGGSVVVGAAGGVAAFFVVKEFAYPALWWLAGKVTSVARSALKRAVELAIRLLKERVQHEIQRVLGFKAVPLLKAPPAQQGED